VRRLGVALLLVLASCGGGDGESTVRVFAAASLTDVFAEIADAFGEEHPDVDVQLEFGPSSGLATQIREGAPADVFASADEAAMADATDAGAGATPFAANSLVLAVPSGNPGGVGAVDDLADPSLLVGLCVVEVPCGRAARTLLDSIGVAASVDSFEPDVRALLTKLEEGELDAGLVYRTDVDAAGDSVEAVEVPGADDVVNVYPIVALSDEEAAANFVAFVLSEEGQAILGRAGFLPAP
jgi:molybdate transport system substrate-binding protein